MGKWKELGIGLMAALLAVSAITAACGDGGSSDGGDGDTTSRQANDDLAGPEVASEDEGAGGGAFGICLEGTIDCIDTPLNPVDADCPPDAPDCGGDVVDPGFSCEPGMTVEECLPDGVPTDYECVTLESFPVQVKCYPVDCAVTTLPASVDQETAEDIAAREEAACDPPIDPCSPEPQPNVRCLPPDCAVSNDGSVACPGNGPCEPSVDDCSVPSEPGVACPERPELTEQECASSGGGVDAVPPTEVEPPPAAQQ